MSGQQQSKRRYVGRAAQTRRHSCHWPGCTKQVPPAMWGCKEHWYRLPRSLRDKIWDTYSPGQEERLDPSSDYLEAAREVQEWIKANT